MRTVIAAAEDAYILVAVIRLESTSADNDIPVPGAAIVLAKGHHVVPVYLTVLYEDGAETYHPDILVTERTVLQADIGHALVGIKAGE